MSKLTSRQHFNRVIRRGKKVFGAIADVIKTPNGLERTRIGIITPKNRFDLAVKRNRVRRVFKEAYRELKKEYKIEGLDIVIFPKAGAVEKGLAEAKETLIKALIGKS